MHSVSREGSRTALTCQYVHVTARGATRAKARGNGWMAWTFELGVGIGTAGAS